jgi:hypothetical protein
MEGRTDKTGQFVLDVDKPADNAAVFEEAQAAEERGDIATAERLYRRVMKIPRTRARRLTSGMCCVRAGAASKRRPPIGLPSGPIRISDPPKKLSEIILEAPRKSMTNSMCSHRADHMERITMIESISAVTLATHNMPHAVRFYRVLGFEIVHGDDNAAFTSFWVGDGLRWRRRSRPKWSRRNTAPTYAAVPASSQSACNARRRINLSCVYLSISPHHCRSRIGSKKSM